MAKRTISFADYDEPTWEDYTGEEPPVGRWYNARLKKVNYLGDKDEDQLMFVFEITDGDYKGWGRGLYAPFEGQNKWKMHQTLKSLQGGKTNDVTVDWENEKAVAAWVAKQKPVKLKTRQYEEKTYIDKVAPMLEALPGGKSAPKEAELPGDVDAGDEEIADYTVEELGAMEVADLEEILIEEFELAKDDEDFPEKGAGRGAAVKYKEALVKAILAEQAGDDEEGDTEDAAEEGEEDEDFEDGFEEEEEEEPEPEPAPRTRRSRTAPAKAALTKAAAPAKAAPARRRRG